MPTYNPVLSLSASRPPRVSSGYGQRSTGMHPGADVMYRKQSGDPSSLPTSSPNYYMPSGRAAVAYADGVVLLSSDLSKGGRVRIDHGGGLWTAYYHLASRSVKVGDRVTGGQRIGTIGHGKTAQNPSGYALNHLHFEVFVNGRTVDPEPYLAQATVLSRPKGDLLIPLLIGGVAIGYLAFLRYRG